MREDIQALIDSVQIGDLIEPDYDETVDITGKLTPFGKFVIKLEHIVHRDNKLIKELTKRLQR